MSNDYFMRQIEDMARFLASAIFLRRPAYLNVVTQDGSVSSGSLLHLKIRALLADGDINGAENLLHATIESDPLDEYLPVALDFYEALSGMSDEQLTAASFSRQEVAEGLAAVARRYGYTPRENTR